MALPTFTANTAALAEDVTSIVTHLQGASGNTEAWHFRCSTSNNFLITLSDAAGARKFSIRDSALAEVFSVDSDGNVTLSGAITTGTFTFPTSATPTPTTEGQASWDTDDNLIAVGDSAATKIIIPTPTTTAGDIEYASGARAHSRLAIGTAGQVLTVNAGATAPQWGAADFFTGWLATMLSPTYKGFWWTSGSHASLGSSAGTTTYAAGFGVLAVTGSSGVVGDGTSTDSSAWLLSTGTTSASSAYFQGPQQVITSDYTVVCRFKAPSAASQTVVIGQTTNATPTDQNGFIGFRILTTGNVFGVCDSAGTETTRDSGATAVTEAVYHYVVSSGGTIVRFYKNGVQIGADVTTNIPSLTTNIIAGISTQTTVNKTMIIYELGGYRELA